MIYTSKGNGTIEMKQLCPIRHAAAEQHERTNFSSNASTGLVSAGYPKPCNREQFNANFNENSKSKRRSDSLEMKIVFVKKVQRYDGGKKLISLVLPACNNQLQPSVKSVSVYPSNNSHPHFPPFLSSLCLRVQMTRVIAGTWKKCIYSSPETVTEYSP
ncbi:hypothetical protein JOB18_007209 [Solea senegalensis]|uniref:Uncharacterized protein n=1 Tax=Solea senegalensis TaxID=28829 RepID=A0AAV6SHE7_SOLSE|nr:hypothetical protein JOB18_007209 [Solea senegalensis]